MYGENNGLYCNNSRAEFYGLNEENVLIDFGDDDNPKELDRIIEIRVSQPIEAELSADGANKLRGYFKKYSSIFRIRLLLNNGAL